MVECANETRASARDEASAEGAAYTQHTEGLGRVAAPAKGVVHSEERAATFLLVSAFFVCLPFF